MSRHEIKAELNEAKRLVARVNTDLKDIGPDNIDLTDIEYNQDDLKDAIVGLNAIWELLQS